MCPPSSRDCYSESIVYMPHSYFVNDYKQVGLVRLGREGRLDVAKAAGAAVLPALVPGLF